MTDTLRDKLINKGWVTSFNVDTLVRLIEEHYAERIKPVPVSERLPGPEDCDAEGRCWCGTPSFVNSYAVTQSAQWRLSAPDDRFGSELFWLPARALPLPGQEVEQ